MLAAEKRRKVRTLTVADSLARDEDFVTSTVFGLLSYLPAAQGLGALLNVLVRKEEQPTDVRLTFWPEDEGTEPDVVLETQRIIVLVEAKIDAPFGSNQLGREWLWLRRRAKQVEAAAPPGQEPPRLLIATITRRPLEDAELQRRIVADLLELGSLEASPTEDEVRAMTWHEAADRLLRFESAKTERHVQTILDDLNYFLQSRGLRQPPFNAWPEPPRGWPDCPRWYVEP